MTAARTVVVGGGIAGLSAAWELRRRDPDIDLTLLEAGDRAGGKLRTESVDGFLLESGPDSVLSHKPATWKLAGELGIGGQRLACRAPRHSVFVLRDGAFHMLPRGFRLAVATELWPMLRSRLLSLPGKLRMAMEPFVRPRRGEGDESLAAFLRRRLGREAADRIACPLLSGIYSTDPERMSLLATFEMLAKMEREHGSLGRAMRAQSKTRPAPEPGAPPPAMFSTFRDGMQCLPDALAEQLGDALRTRAAVREIERRPDGYRLALDGETIEAERLVMATPGPVTARLLAPLDADLAEAVAAIRCVTTANVSAAFDLDALPDLPVCESNGFIVPPLEGRALQATTFTHQKFDGRVPRGGALLRGFFSATRFAGLDELTGEELDERARSEWRDLLGLDAAPRFTRVSRWPEGSPQYEVGHRERVAAIEAGAAERLPGLLLLGSAFRATSVPDLVEDSRSAIATEVT